MTDAHDLRMEIDAVISLAEAVQVQALYYETAIRELQGAVLLLDLRSNNQYTRSVARMAPGIGENLFVDKEVTGQVKTELEIWRGHV